MYNAPLLPEQFYHVFNHAVGNENLFRAHENYSFFLERYAHYIFPIARTYAYCLMPNHFHLVIQIRDGEALHDHYCKLKKRSSEEVIEFDYAQFAMQQFSNFCNSYAKAYNRRFMRKGALFLDFIRRNPVENETYFTALLAYVHRNPVHHGFCNSVADWPYSSFSSMISQKSTRLERNTVLKLVWRH